MIDAIRQLEKTAKQLHTNHSTRAHWNKLVNEAADQFLGTIENTNAYHMEAFQGQFEIPENPVPPEQILKTYQEKVLQHGINAASGKHFGYIPGGGLFSSALADYLAAMSNCYVGIAYACPGAVKMENDCLRWICNMVGYPETALGNLASGGSIATLTAITTAREARGIKARDFDRQVIYLSQQTHHCLHKALRIAGLGEAILRQIPMDDRFKIKTDALEAQIKKDVQAGLEPFLIVGSVGTTDTGAIDPLEAMADLAEAYNLWFHVDAAYGGFFLLLDEIKAANKAISRSDSITIDPHKSLFIPYGLGAVVIKDVKAQYQAHFYKANYMQDSFQENIEISPSDLSPELTKHFRALRMWLPLQLYGLQPFRAALKEKLLLCRYFYQKIQDVGFSVGPFPELSVMIFRYEASSDSNTFNRELLEMVHKDGRVFLSSTQIKGVFWIRMAILSFRTHLKEVDLCLSILEGSKNRLLSKSYS